MHPPAELIRHAAHPRGSADRIQVTASRPASGGLRLHFQVAGAQMLLPPPATPTACDGLWQHTCCEAFIAEAAGDAYREFNFSPAGQWAAYRFLAYRQRDTAFVADGAPHIEVHADAAGFQLTAHLPASLLPAAPTLRLGLSAVIEGRDGSKAYWALAHPGAQADFHRPDTFTLFLDSTAP